MTPVDVLMSLRKANPAAANFLYGGIGVFAAIAVVLNFKIDLQTAILVGLIILVFALLVVALSRAHGAVTTVLAWGFVILLLTTTTIFIYAASVADPSPFRPPECLIRFYEKCEAVQDDVAARNETPVDVQDIASPPLTSSVNKDAFTVYIQFAGFRRDDVAEAAKALVAVGWKIRQPDKGGERTASAAGLSEVRYHSDAQAAAAELLASEIEKTGLSADVKTREVGVVGADKLEVWISL